MTNFWNVQRWNFLISKYNYLKFYISLSFIIDIIDIRKDNFTKHPHLYKQLPSRSVKSLKKKMEKLHRKYVFAPADKVANNVIIICKRHYVEDLKGELNSTSTYIPAQLTKDQLLVHHINTLTKSMSKLIKVNCLHFIGCQNYTNVLMNRVLYQIQVTAILPFFLSILHMLLQLSKIMLWSTAKLLLAIVMSIIFGPLKLFRGHRKVATV